MKSPKQSGLTYEARFSTIIVNAVQKEVAGLEQRETKKRIIKTTTQLIEQYNGELDQSISQLIAEKAGIGLGSINYYFKAKPTGSRFVCSRA